MLRESLPPAVVEAIERPARAPALRRLARWAAWAAVAMYFALACGFLAVRYVVLPNAGEYREEVARRLSQALGLKVTLGGIDAHWQGLHPELGLVGLQIHDHEGRPALALDYVVAELSWTSFASARLDLRRLEIIAPRLSIRREADGELYVAGIRMRPDASGGGLSDWLLAQPRLVVRDAALEWTDAMRGAPTLALEHVNLRAENSGRRHRIGLTADPPRALAARLDVRADLSGERLGKWSEWTGQVYAHLDYADLSAWRQWVDYPLALPRGVGGLRAWLTLGPGRLEALTGEIALSDVELRLRPDLPTLELLRLSGRIEAKRVPGGWDIAGRRLALATHDGVDLPAADYQLRWSSAASGATGMRGTLAASALDLDAATRLAAHLPLSDEVRARLVEYAPRGVLTGVSATWEGEGWPARYEVRADFDRLAVNAVGVAPGFDGFSGHIEANQKAGSLRLNGRDASVRLPRVFPEPRIALREASARLFWTVSEEATEVQLQSVSFSNSETAGTASGRYRTRPSGPGEIDLTAQLTRADGPSVWRYLPFVVGQHTRDWVRSAITGGRADGARLKLKGDLAEFPFAGGRSTGQFQVKANVSGVTLRYAEGWPEIRNVSGELLFEGVRMLVRTRSGSVLGTQLGAVSAEIPDLNAWVPLLRVQGSAAGPTAEFLRFIAESPVAGMIDHYTEGIRAQGEGALQLKLELPLGNLDGTRVEGEYRFSGNTVLTDYQIPPLTDAAATVAFTNASLGIRDATANLLGTPIALRAVSQPEGVQFDVTGTMSAASLRRELGWSWLDHLSGATDWHAVISVRRKTATLSLDSSLRGLSSSLPDPLNKPGPDAMALRVERTIEEGAAADGRERVRIGLGSVLQADLVRAPGTGGGSVVERAAIGIGATARLPAQGVTLNAAVARLNLDAWRRLLVGGGGTADVGAVASVSVRAGELTAFGQSFADFDLRAALSEGVWQAQVTSREMAGELSWRLQGRGRLHARLSQLSLLNVNTPQGVLETRGEDEELKELPGLDVVAEEFRLRGRNLGKLELQAVNRGPVWRIDRMSLANPESTLTGGGQWVAGASAANTQLAFKLDVTDVGKLLERLGYPEVVRRGSAQLEGGVSWTGAPTSIDYPSLNGTLTVQANRGQFNKLEPGVGRLLGILSLQSLPRRITLDFRDVFSEGFAFDSISGSIRATRGVLESDGLLMQGPAAKVRMSGTVNLPHETQDLRVRVQPAIGDSVSLGAALLNPVVGVASLLAQKILSDPIDQMFAYDYSITGSWADPKVEKLRAPDPGAASAR